LDPECYNGTARVINGFADEIQLHPDSIQDNPTTMIYVRNTEKGDFTGSVRQVVGDIQSYKLRTKIKEKGEIEFWKDLKKDLLPDVDIFSTTLDSIGNLEQNLGINYEFALRREPSDVLYFSPMLGNEYKRNPFKADQRAYPIEMPYAIDQTYLL